VSQLAGVFSGFKSLHAPYETMIFLQSNAYVLFNKITLVYYFNFILLRRHLMIFWQLGIFHQGTQ
jgi:hypothetical protein